jgi:hypothetical protein
MALTICNLVRGYDVDTLFEDWKTREIITLHRNWNSIASRFVNLVADFYEYKL